MIGRPKKWNDWLVFFTFETSEASFAADAPNRGAASPVSLSFGRSAAIGRVFGKKNPDAFDRCGVGITRK